MFSFQNKDAEYNYLQNELEALEREQKQIDKQAGILEKELRRVMETGKSLASSQTRILYRARSHLSWDQHLINWD